MNESKRWVQHVAETSNALDLPKGVFSHSARAIAQGLSQAAHASTRRKGTEFQSAMSMLNYHINRGGRGLPADRKRELERAKDELRKLYGRPKSAAGPVAPKRTSPSE